MRPIIPNSLGGSRQPNQSQLRIVSSYSTPLLSPNLSSVSSLPLDEPLMSDADINKLANTLDKETGHYLAYHYTIPRIVSLMTHNNYLDQDLRKVGERAIDVVGKHTEVITSRFRQDLSLLHAKQHHRRVDRIRDHRTGRVLRGACSSPPQGSNRRAELGRRIHIHCRKHHWQGARN